jgi:hypothetical protein
MTIGTCPAGRGEPFKTLREVNDSDLRAAVLEAEPRPVVSVPDPQLVEVAAVFADLPHGLDPTLGMGVRFRRPDRRPEDLHSLATEHLVEAAREFGVVVAEQELD